MVAIVVKKKQDICRSVEILFNKFSDDGENLLGRIPEGPAAVHLEQSPDEAVSHLLPARIDAFGQRLRRISFSSSFALMPRLPLPLRVCSGPLGPVRWGSGDGGAGVWWCFGHLEGSRSTRRSRRDERSDLLCVGLVSRSIRQCVVIRTTVLSRSVSALLWPINEKVYSSSLPADAGLEGRK